MMQFGTAYISNLGSLAHIRSLALSFLPAALEPEDTQTLSPQIQSEEGRSSVAEGRSGKKKVGCACP